MHNLMPPPAMEISPHLYRTLPLGLILLCVLYVRSIVRWRARSRGRPLPPGPPSLPVVGNLFNIPGERAWFAFRDLTTQYGESSSSFHRVVDTYLTLSRQ